MIRRALPKDAGRLLEMGAAFNIEAGYAETVPFNELDFCHTLSALAKAGLVLVATDDEDRAVGMAAADVAASICNHSVRFAREAFWYIEPELRKGIGRELLSALELVVRDYGANYFDAVAEAGERSTALGRLYRRAGFSPAEQVFRKRLN